MAVDLRQGDCVEVMAGLEAGSVDAVVCDPPYSLGFMSKAWDSHGGDEDAGFGYYLSGLIDGEGHFRVGSGERRCEFGMKLRADDEWILRRVMAFVGHGRIAHEPRRDGSAPQAKFVLDSKDGCAALCEILLRYPLRAKKLRDFLTWAEAVDEWLTMPRGNRWHGPADRSRLSELGQRLRDGRSYSEVAWSGNAYQDWCRRWGEEAVRVLKPGGHVLAFGGTRTYHRLAAGLEDAGLEIRDCVSWLYGSGLSGFPKSLDVSKAIDARAGAEREVIGEGRYADRRPRPGEGVTMHMPAGDPQTAPATDDASHWQGWGTALKPAHEPVVVARKPLVGTVAGNVLAHGVGALNVDGCRIGTEEQLGRFNNAKPTEHNVPDSHPDAKNLGRMQQESGWVDNSSGLGRWPANVVLDEEAAAALDPSGEWSRFFYVCGDESGMAELTSGGVTPEAERSGSSLSIAGSGSKLTDRSPQDSTSTTETETPSTTTSRTSNCLSEDGISGTTVGSEPQQLSETGSADVPDAVSGSPSPSTPHAEARSAKATVSPARGSTFESGENGTASTTTPTTGSTEPDTKRGFYVAKASRAERNAGLDGFEATKRSDEGYGSIQTPILDRAAPRENWTPHATANHHPTVKPIALMRWLVRLVTPPDGLILDPFLGSGTTGIAAALEGFRFLGIEREPDYLAIARARIAFWEEHGEDGLRIVAARELAEAKRQEVAASGQLDLLSTLG